MDFTMQKPHLITQSRHCMFLIFSYTDYAPEICRNVRLINRKFNLWATARDGVYLNLLVKQEKIFLMRNLDEISVLGKINLLNYNFGFDVAARHFLLFL